MEVETWLMWILSALILATLAWIFFSMRAGGTRSDVIGTLEARLEATLKRRLEALGPAAARFDEMRALTQRPVDEVSRYFARYIMFSDDSQLRCELISQHEVKTHQLCCVSMALRDGEEVFKLHVDDAGARIQWRDHSLALSERVFTQLARSLDMSSTTMTELIIDHEQVLVRLVSPLLPDPDALVALLEQLWDERARLSHGWAARSDAQLIEQLLDMIVRFDETLDLDLLNFLDARLTAHPALKPKYDALIHAKVEEGNAQAISAVLLRSREPIALSDLHARQLWEVIEHHPLRQQIVEACPVQFAAALTQALLLPQLGAACLLELARQAPIERFEALVTPLFHLDDARIYFKRLKIICAAPPELAWARLISIYPLSMAARETMPAVGSLDISELWKQLLWMWRQCWPLCSEEQRAALLTWLEQVCLNFSQGALARHGSSESMTVDALVMLSELGGVMTIKVLDELRQRPPSAMTQRAPSALAALQKRLKQQGAHVSGALSLSAQDSISGGLSLLDEAQRGQLSVTSPED